MPDDFPLPPDGVHIRWPDGFLDSEARMQDYKIYAALHYCRANSSTASSSISPKPRARHHHLAAKATSTCARRSTTSASREADAAEIGIRVYKVAMPWPLEPEGVRHFAEGLDEILVVEEKRQIVEYQLKEQLYNWRDRCAPARGRQVRRKRRVDAPARRLAAARGKRADAGDDRARDRAAHRAARAASAAQGEDRKPRRVHQRQGSGAGQAEDQPAAHPLLLLRLPAQHVDQGARRQPRDRGHRLPRDGDLDGSLDVDVHAHGRRRRALDRPGAFHRREAHLRQPRRRHLLPLRRAGDPRRGRGQSQHHLQDSLQRRGRDDRRPAGRRTDLAGGSSRGRSPPKASKRSSSSATSRTSIHPAISPPAPRSIIATTWTRCSASCARRRAARSCSTTRPARPKSAGAASAASIPDPAKRVVINELVCEGCGDCGVKSNCVSVAPVETEFGRKRTIDQSSCNKDFSCVNGFCPSFVTVEGGGLRKPKQADALDVTALPEPARAGDDRALRHPGHRHRRHRRRDHRRIARHGRASRGQRLQRARHDRPRAKERRRRVACAHRRHARADPRDANRRRRSEAGAGLRHPDRRRRRGARQDAEEASPGRWSTPRW